MIPEADDGNSLFGQKFVACSIVCFTKAVSVAGTIQFDGEFHGGTIEIQNVTFDWMLPSEFVTYKVSISKMAPKNTFTVGGVLAQVTGESHLGIV
jgi:hypothetical protein